MDSMHQDHLRHLMKTHPDPRVRHRVHGVLLVSEGRSMSEVARLFHTAHHCLRT